MSLKESYINFMLVFLLCFGSPRGEEVGKIIVEGWNEANSKVRRKDWKIN